MSQLGVSELAFYIYREREFWGEMKVNKILGILEGLKMKEGLEMEGGPIRGGGKRDQREMDTLIRMLNEIQREEDTGEFTMKPYERMVINSFRSGRSRNERQNVIDNYNKTLYGESGKGFFDISFNTDGYARDFERAMNQIFGKKFEIRRVMWSKDNPHSKIMGRYSEARLFKVKN